MAADRSKLYKTHLSETEFWEKITFLIQEHSNDKWVLLIKNIFFIIMYILVMKIIPKLWKIQMKRQE